MLRCGRCQYDENPPGARQCERCGYDLPRQLVLPAGARLLGGALTVGRDLARGGFGITYEGSVKDAPVAIKEFFPDGSDRDGLLMRPPADWKEGEFALEKERFLHIWEQVSHAAHPGIVGVHRVFAENATGYVVMEYLPGRTLQDLVEEQGPLAEAEALACAGRIGAAVERLHQAGLVHLDLKPQNVVVTDAGRLTLIDFDAARELGARRGALSRRLTPGFAPPEQYHPDAVFTPAADVYGLAATLYFLLTAQIPADAPARDRGAPLPAVHRWTRDVTERVTDGIAAGMALAASARPRSVSHFLGTLDVELDADGTVSVGAAGTTRWYSPGEAVVGGKEPPTAAGQARSPAARTAPPPAAPRLVGEHRGPVHCVAFSPDGHTLASAGEDGTVRLWDISRWDTPRYVQRRRLEGHEGAVTSVVFDPAAVWIATGGCDQNVRLWSCEPGTAERRLSGHTGWVSCLAFGPEGDALLSGSVDGTFGFWPLAGGLGPARRLEGADGAICGIATGPDGRLVVTTGEDGLLRLWDLARGEVVGRLAGHTGPVWSLALRADRMPAAPPLKRARALLRPEPVPLFDAATLASGGRDGTVRVWDAAARKQLHCFQDHRGSVNSVAIRPDGRKIASAGDDRTIRLWTMGAAPENRIFEGHDGPVGSVAFSPDGKILASGGWDGTVRLWEVG